ncbi:methylated-DNA--[protein]-cysteine S-methyltransferase [Dongia mobilis]|uniref:methylated-DNA--[protein]-cysteine S-methyltransferase n=1 Tax=Dongia mobilis TaxID=578943 RepID=UPI0014150954|nr:methylated-DNA--[protein]-cysteine S-methyltransferase [Dongia mobilis]
MASSEPAFVPTGAILRTAIGWIDIRADEEAVTQLHWRAIEPGVLVSNPLAEEAKRQVEAYLAGRLTRFDLPLRYAGSEFARHVWDMLLRIPYGETRRYGHLSALIGGEATGNDARAIGSACGQNPIAVIIPCHRVIGAAALGGYSGDLGLTAKRFLLDLEKGQGRLF